MRSQKGNALGWVIFATLTVGAFAALWAIQSKPKAPEATPPTEVGETVKKPFRGFAKETLSPEAQAEQDNEALNAALRGGDCESIQFDLALRQSCLDTQAYDLALRNNDERRCAEIKDVAMRTDCLDRVYSALSAQTLDLALCEKISNTELKQQCKDRIKASMGRTATSAKDCEGIQDEVLKQSCLDDFILTTSVQNLSIESCGSIQNADLKSRCTETVTKNVQVAEISKTQMVRQYQSTQTQLANCSEQVGQTSQDCKDQANFSLAAEKKDLAYCNAIVNAELKKNCIETQGAAINKYYMRIATAKKDPSLCSKILDSELRATCLTFSQ